MHMVQVAETYFFFALCPVLFRTVTLDVAPWYDGCNNLVQDCCTVMVFAAHVMVRLAVVVLVYISFG